jgi:transposase
MMFKLSDGELRGLKSFMNAAAHKHQWHLRLRGSVVIKASEGWTIADISKSLNICPKAVWNCIDRFRKEGVAGLHDKPRQAKMLSVEQILTLRRMRYPGYPGKIQANWKLSYSKLAKWVKENWQIEISPQRISQLVRKEIYG